MLDPGTLVDLLRRRVEERPDQTAYVVLGRTGAEESRVKYRELDRRARAIAACLQAQGAAGRRVLLLGPPGWEYFSAFLGCVYAGAIAVPTQVSGARGVDRLGPLAADAEAEFALTAGLAADRFDKKLATMPELRSIRRLGTDQIVDELADEWRDPCLSPDSIAFLQYTSGSTASPRGVMVTHRSLLFNERLIQGAFGQDEDSVIVSWLPLFHDMGLIGGAIQPLYAGATCVLMAPGTFLQRPVRWLEAISTYRATTSGGPNFAYDLCVRRIGEEERAGLDLSCWRTAFNGSEPVRAETLDRFAAAFAPCGFKREAFHPCYGLAEATLLVTGGKVAKAPRVLSASAPALARGRLEAAAAGGACRPLVSSGRVLGGQRLLAVAPAARTPCAPGEIGEIWISGPGVAAGYWNQPAETGRTFQAALAGEGKEGKDRFLRTGDLGCIVDGELFVTGRLKEMMILRGRNHYPQDLEETARAAHPALAGSPAAAFAVEVEGEERLVLVQEYEGRARDLRAAELLGAIRVVLAEEHEVKLHAAVLVRFGTIPRTTSGKLRRGKCREEYLAGALTPLASLAWEDGTELAAESQRERALDAAPERRAAVICEHLRAAAARRLGTAGFASGSPEIDPAIALTRLGMDSLGIAELANDAEVAYGVPVDAALLLDGWSLDRLAAWIAGNLPAEVPAIQADLRPAGEPSADDGAQWELSPDQERIWMAEQMRPDGGAFHLQAGYRLSGPLDIERLERAVQAVLRRHETLRSTFRFAGGRVVQSTASEPCPRVRVVEARGSLAAALQLLAREELAPRFDLARGPLLRIAVMDPAGAECALLLTIHHIVCDAWSLGVFLRELGAVYAALAAGRTPDLPPLPLRYRDFVRRQRRAAPDAAKLDGWRSLLAGAAPLVWPVEPASTPSGAAGEQLSFDLAPGTATAVRRLARQQGTTPFTVLLTAFQLLLARYCQVDDLVVAVPVKGRPQAQLDGLIGFFAHPLPIRSRIDGETTFLGQLARTRDAALQSFAGEGVPFELLARIMGTAPGAQALPVMFSLLPEEMAELRLAGAAAMPAVLRAGTSDCDLFLTLIEGRGELRGSVLYDGGRFASETVGRLVEAYVALLARIAAEPSLPISTLRLGGALEQGVERRRAAARTLAVAASFTADPVLPFLAFWMEEIGIPARLELAPYNQIFQQLLDTAGAFARNRAGVNLVLVRASDLLGSLDAGEVPGQIAERSADELAAAVRAAAAGAAATYLVCICPEAAETEASRRWEAALAGGLAGQAGVQVLSSAETLGSFPALEHHDPHGEALAHVPYTEEFFAALGTAVARRVSAIEGVFRAKVIVLDCDDTLWKGVCGEDGPLGVEIDEPHRRLQELMLAQQRAGMILCLASKNNAEDIEAVFRQRPDMLLRREHLTLSRVNWRPKSENLRELAADLDLALDSFVFVDDDPRECAEVRQALPEVLVLELPRDRSRIPDFLRQVWAFDRPAVTAEGKSRTDLYRQNADRAGLRRQSSSLAEFLAGLGLVVDAAAALPAELPRIAELTARTSQFNMTGIRRTAAEIGALLRSGELEARVTRVRDRFGDYGLVGVALFRARGEALEVDTWLLSCRALGRGVEHRMTADLAAIAVGRGLPFLDIGFRPTARNQPARDFLTGLGAPLAPGAGGGPHRFAAGPLASLRYEPPAPAGGEGGPARDLGSEDGDGDAAAVEEAPAHGTEARGSAANRILRLVQDLAEPRQLVRALRARRRRPRPLAESTWVAPSTPLERAVASLAGELLAVDRVGGADNFFDLGAHSLLATQLVSRLRAAYQVDLTLPMLFDAPTVATLAARIEALRPGSAAPAPPLVAGLRPEPLPLSYAQQRLWFLDQLHPGNSFYNINTAVRLRGPLAAPALERALAALVERHEALRTRFPARDGQPVQEILPHAEVTMELVDLSGRAAEEGPRDREAAARARLDAAARQPFVLAEGPLLRTVLVRLEAEDHLLLLCLHHIVSDGWSMGVLVRELSALYAACRDGRTAPLSALAPLPIQYADYGCWQREWLAAGALEAQLAYWRRELAGAPPVLDLPTDRPRPEVESFRGAHRSFAIPAGTVLRLRALARRHGTTLFTVLLAAWETLLYRYTGEDDLVVGVPVANRNRVEVEELIGFFVNTLVLRTDLGGDPPFGELVSRVREKMLGAQAHQDVPFDKLVAELQPDRDLGGAPLFRLLVESHRLPDQDLTLPGMEVDVLPRLGGTSIFDLVLSLEERGERIAADLEYNTDLFEPARIERMAAHFGTLLASAVGDPGRRLTSLDLLTAGERLLLASWNATAAAYDPACLPLRFAEQARRTPEATALVCGERRWSYRELNARSNRLARRLAKLGVGPERLVGICLERQANLLPAVLAVLKAGGAYLPLDPAYPAERIALLTADAGVEVILTEGRLAGAIPVGAARRVFLDAEEEAIAGEREDDPEFAATPENLAYVMYTSGSSGRPKGVAVRHRSAAALLDWALSCFLPEELRGVLASTSICFDISVIELFVPLACGGAVILAGSAFDLPTLPAAGEVTLINTVPSIAGQLVASGAIPPAVRAVSLAGEALPGSLVEDLYRQPSIARVLNLYGPTETTVYSTFALIARGAAGAPPIGRPVANEEIHLLGAGLQQAPPGIPAEICIGGEGVARGYLHRPDLTAERFRPDAWSGRAGARIYRTGDLGRCRADGTLDYLGRLDQQIKLHGYRIEPGEIEAALARHAAVRQAVVVPQRHRAGGMRLVAFVVPAQGQAPRPEELAAFLQSDLPASMVPAHFVLMEALPLTPNGKLDRRRLPLPETDGGERSGPERPRTEVEQILAAVWRQVLGRDEVGIHDNLFRLGGDSILSIQIANRANQAGIPLTPRHLFQHQTIAELAAAAAPALKAAAEQGEVTGAVPLTPIQHWFFEPDLADPGHWNQAILLELRRAWPAAVLEEGIRRLLIHHDALRLRFFRDGGREGARWRQLSTPAGGRTDLALVDLAALPAAARDGERERAMASLQASLDLARGPLLRAAVFATAPPSASSPRHLFLVAHHLVVDAVSWRILLEDLAASCAALAAGEPVRLPAKTLSLRQWSERLQRHAQSDSLRAELPYWSAVERSDAPALPVDFERGANDEASARRLALAFTADETRALLLDFRATYRMDVEETLLAVLAAAAARWTGADRLTVDVEGHGREEIGAAGLAGDPSRTVGWFTTIYPLRLELAPAGELLDTVKAVKEQLRAVPRRGIGYGVLRYLAAGGLGAPPQPGAGISFNYLGQLDHVLGGDAPFALAAGSTGPAHSPRARRRHLLEVVAQVDGGRLEVLWTYSAGRHRETTVGALAESFAGSLRELIRDRWAACQRTWTGRDFPLAGLTQRELQQVVATVPAAGAAVEDIYALSPAQKGMLFHSLYAPRSGMYIMQLVCTLGGDLDLTLFEEAWRQTVERYTTLRTSFLWEGLDHSVQVVHRHVGLGWTVLDWRALPTVERDERLAAFLQADRSRGFELQTAPLSRLVLVATGAREHRFVWSYHHLLLDGWSTALVLASVVERYEELAAGRSGVAAEPPSYRSYIAWLSRQAGAGAEAFWRRRLGGFAAPTRLRLDRGAAAGAREIEEFATLDARLAPALHAALLGLARASRLTLHTLLQGAWALLLGHYSGSDDVVFGTVVAGRPPDLAGVDAIAGLFVNTLPVRARLVGAEPLLGWLHALQDSESEMRQHESSPLVDVQGWSDLPRSQPLFESIFSLNSYPIAGALRGEGRRLHFRDVAVIDWNSYPLSVAVDAVEHLAMRVKFDPRRFDSPAITGALRLYETLLEAVVARPQALLSELAAVMAEADRLRQLDAGAAYQSTVQRRFEQIRVRLQASADPPSPTAGGSGEVA